MNIGFIDVKRSYFHAKARLEVYMALPADDWEEGKCGRRREAKCGAMNVAHNWKYDYAQASEDLGIRRG